MTIIETLRKIVEEKQYAKYKKQTIDMQTANVMLTVYEALSEDRKQLFIEMGNKSLLRLINFCWRQVELA